MQCLDEIIGLSQTECECFTESLESDQNSEYNISRSGLFLDELDGFNKALVSGAESCAEGSIWDIMQQSVENAKKDFVRDMLGCVNQKYMPKLKNFAWQLGESTFSGTNNSITGTHCGMRVSPLQLKGGFIYLKRIGVLINENANVTLQVYSDKDGSTLLYENSSTPLAAVANTLTWGSLATPLELPMWDSCGAYIRYYVVMLLNGTFKPKKNKRDCGCGGSKKPVYLQWLDVLGVSGSDTTDMLGFRTDSKFMNGITLDVEVKCKTTEVICSSEFPLDYDEDGGAMNIARCIQLLAGIKCYKKILSSEVINRFTMMKGDQANESINAWTEQYQTAVLALCEDVHIDANDCLMCKVTKTSLIKNTILT